MRDKNMEQKIIDSSFFKIMRIIATITTITAAAIGIYQFLSEDKIKIEVMVIDKMELTKIPDVEDLTAKHMYKDSVVKDLWKISYIIRNISSKTIIAKGSSKNTITEILPVSFKDSVKVLSVKIEANNFPIIIADTNDNFITLDFKQWKQSEYVYITAIIQNFNKTEPSMIIDDRDIIDSEVIHSDYKSIQINKNRKAIEYLAPFPAFVAFLKAGAIGSILGIVIAIIILVIESLKVKKIKKIELIFLLITMALALSSLLWIF
jgi:hypothetical protein